jgi:hypothetical protein
MAARFAVANGNWSNPATWDIGAVPVDGDGVHTNGFNVTIDQNINVLRLSNQLSPTYLPGTATPVMTSNTTPSGVAFASSQFSLNEPPWLAFDQSTTTAWRSGTANSGSIGYQFPTGKIIKQYAFISWSSNNFNPRNWTFEGSNDGVTYTIIETVTAFTTVVDTWYVRNVSANTTSYAYYRMNITTVQVAGNTPIVRELNLSESTGSIYATSTSGSFISGGGIQISASAQYGIESSGGTTPVGLACFIITGSHFVGITGSILGPNAGFSNTRYGVIIRNGGTASIVGDVFGANAGGGSSGVFGLYIITGSAFITGSLRCINNNGNTQGHPLVINNGTASISGTLQSATNCSPISILAGNAQVNFTGNAVINGTSTSNMQIGGTNSGTLNYTGPVIGNNNPGIQIAGTMNVNISGSISSVGGTSVASGFYSQGTGIITINGSITSTNSSPGLQSLSTALIRVTGPLISQNNFPAVYAQRVQLLSTSTPYYKLQSDTFNKDIIFYDTSYTSSLPAQTNVRSGSLYGGSNEFSGSMVVPSTSSVRYGVPVDNTTGSATLTPQDILNYAVSSLTGSNSIGARLQNIATVQTTAATIAAFKGK